MPSPPFRAEREGTHRPRGKESEAGADQCPGILHLSPTLSTPQWPKGAEREHWVEYDDVCII